MLRLVVHRFFTQHHVDQLDCSLTPVECLATVAPGIQAIDLRAHLGTVTPPATSLPHLLLVSPCNAHCQLKFEQ